MKRCLALLLCLSLLTVPVQAQEDEKLVALTFDDGPSGRFTRKLLDGLQKWDAKATFLLCGYRMELDPALTERICQEGHEIGLHGFTHKSMEHMGFAEVSREIQKTMELLPAGCQVQFLRPPGGITGKETGAAAKAWGLSLLHWSVDPRDWATHDAAAVERQVILQVKDGDIVLLHDMTDSSVRAALAIVEQLHRQGFRFVTVSELARARGCMPEPGREYARFSHENTRPEFPAG